MDINKSKKRVTIFRVGNIATVSNVIKECANWITIELNCWDMKKGNRPIVYQLVNMFLRYIMSGNVKEWLSNFSHLQTQVRFIFFQCVKSVMVDISKSTQSVTMLSWIEAKNFY